MVCTLGGKGLINSGQFSETSENAHRILKHSSNRQRQNHKSCYRTKKTFTSWQMDQKMATYATNSTSPSQLAHTIKSLAKICSLMLSSLSRDGRQ